METSSWPLRIALLVIGLTVLGAIYLWAMLRRRREMNRRYDRKMRGLRTPPIPRQRQEPAFDDEARDLAGAEDADASPLPEDDFEIVVVTPRDRVDDLPTITHDPGARPAAGDDAPSRVAPADPVGSRPPRRRRTNQLSLGLEDEAPAPPSLRPHRGERSDRRNAPRPAASPPQPEVLALYLHPLRSPTLLGPALLRAFNAVGLRFGEMNIYHHFGAGDLRTEQPLFSLANMYEPGHFDPSAMDDFETTGLAMFIQFPAPLDGPVAFELFLNTAQRLAEALDADLLSEPDKSLDGATIENMRLVAARHSGAPA